MGGLYFYVYLLDLFFFKVVFYRSEEAILRVTLRTHCKSLFRCCSCLENQAII